MNVEKATRAKEKIENRERMRHELIILAIDNRNTVVRVKVRESKRTTRATVGLRELERVKARERESNKREREIQLIIVIQ